MLLPAATYQPAGRVLWGVVGLRLSHPWGWRYIVLKPLNNPSVACLLLQDLSLDAAFLPELRELVYAAARGNIPASGPGALTGLCLLDQAVTSAAQLAALSQLSSLAGTGLGL
jgi:hypothetical protein